MDKCENLAERSDKSSKKSKERKRKSKQKRKRYSSSSSVDSTSSSDFSTSSSSSKRLKEAKCKSKKSKKKKLKKVKRKNEKVKDNDSTDSDDNIVIGPEVPNNLVDLTKRMAPETKEEWEKRQNVIKKVYDEQTGRYRLIKGDGEVLEEIVSKDRHKEINKQATIGDGQYFQSKLPQPKIN